MKNHYGIYLIAGCMAVAATAFFFVVQVTPTFCIAYFFTLLAIALFLWGSRQIIKYPGKYPWQAAFPLRILRYFLAQIVLSAVFVLRENLFEGAFPAGLLFILQTALFAYYAASLFLMKEAEQAIGKREEEVKREVSQFYMLRMDVESALRKYPAYAEPLGKVAEALRYSDPMTPPELKAYDEKIRRTIALVTESGSAEPEKIPEICDDLLQQIADRNSRVRMMK